jgi:hypothetical protein
MVTAAGREAVARALLMSGDASAESSEGRRIMDGSDENVNVLKMLRQAVVLRPQAKEVVLVMAHGIMGALALGNTGNVVSTVQPYYSNTCCRTICADRTACLILPLFICTASS